MPSIRYRNHEVTATERDGRRCDADRALDFLAARATWEHRLDELRRLAGVDTGAHHVIEPRRSRAA